MRAHDDMPPWLDLLLQPGIAQILTALCHHGIRNTEQLSRSLGGRRAAALTGQAVRRLGTYGLVQRTDGGSYDEYDLHACYRLTTRGARFVQAAYRLLWFITERLPMEPHGRRLYR